MNSDLIRKSMAAAVTHELRPRQISFAGALQTVAGVMGPASVAEPSLLRRWAVQKMESIAMIVARIATVRMSRGADLGDHALATAVRSLTAASPPFCSS